MMNWRLEQQQLQRLRAHESQVIDVHETAPLRRQIRICTQIRQKNSRINKMRLAFLLVRTQARQQAGGRSQAYVRTRQPYPLAIPQTENSAREFREILDRIKTARVPAFRIR